jgi:hypothetical protein
MALEDGLTDKFGDDAEFHFMQLPGAKMVKSKERFIVDPPLQRLLQIIFDNFSLIKFTRSLTLCFEILQVRRH